MTIGQCLINQSSEIDVVLLFENPLSPTVVRILPVQMLAGNNATGLSPSSGRSVTIRWGRRAG